MRQLFILQNAAAFYCQTGQVFEVRESSYTFHFYPYNTMLIHNCPFPYCDYATTDLTDNLAITLLQMHQVGIHTNPGGLLPRSKKYVDQACLLQTLAKNGQLPTRWDDYKMG